MYEGIIKGANLGMQQAAALQRSIQNYNDIPTKMQSPIEEKIMRIGSRIDLLQERVSDLRKRLEPVSAPQVTGGGACGESTPQPPMAPLERDLEALAARLSNVGDDLSNLLAYLHV